MKEIPDLHSALRHPIRRRILSQLLGSNEPLTPSVLSTTFREPLSNLSYHIRVLLNQEAIVLVDTERVRGAMKHFYVAAPVIEDTEWIRALLNEHELAEEEEGG